MWCACCRHSSSTTAISTKPSTSSRKLLPPGRRRNSVPRHFLDLDVLPREQLRDILDIGAAFKAKNPPQGEAKPLAGKALAMIFEKPSTRTRVSFELGMRELGGGGYVGGRG